MGGLIVMNLPSRTQAREFNRVIGEAGTLEIHGDVYPRIQLLGVEQILMGERFRTPNATG